MKVIIYADGSTKDSLGVASSLILTSTHFLAFLISEHSVRKSVDTEFLAISQALTYVHDYGFPYSKIICYTDSLKVVDTFYDKEDPYNGWAVRRFREAYKKLGYTNIEIKYTKGHPIDFNENSLCDLHANLTRLHLQPGQRVFRNKRQRKQAAGGNAVEMEYVMKGGSLGASCFIPG